MTKSGLGSLLLAWKFKGKENGLINQGSLSPACCSRQGQLWDQASLLWALSSWVLKTCKGGDGTISLGPCYTACLPSWGNSFSI